MYSEQDFISIAAAFLLVVSITQPTFTCSKFTLETLEKGIKYVQS